MCQSTSHSTLKPFLSVCFGNLTTGVTEFTSCDLTDCIVLQDKDKWSKEKFEISNRAKAEADRLAKLEDEAAEKAK